ncbi:hypothetical protein [Mycobacterium ostraviense]|uniref:Uncharacterized protein n=1 Tax=Mycobacterium ostraviense TaxID=2738409 RepID=A0A164BJF3_9MYCO|nr:hypothetical protein [Mycobacterium ostraviense]KZS63551.1 hypothetical protein A4G28_10240 [Mycobacterium ostraviense]UGT92018.1 hypothetical protein LTS72_00690 [Mycobacterium ostraviense]
MTTSPLGEPLSTNLVEHYLRTRGKRYFRGRHDGEFFFVANAYPRRLHIHLEISLAHPDVFTIRVAPAYFFPAADRARLAQFADLWNARNHAVTAIVHGSSDPQRVGVTACNSQWIPGPVWFNEFADNVDRALDAAVDLFGQLSPVAGLPQPTAPLLLDAG